MTLNMHREKFNRLSIKVGIAFSRLGLSANQWTVLTVIPAAISSYFLVNRDFLPAAVFLLAAGFIDMVDGAVARVTGTVSKLGAYLDTVIDRYVEFAIIAGLLFARLPSVIFRIELWILAYLFGAMMTTYAKAAAKEKDITSKELRGGILERAERLIILFFGLLLAHYDLIYLSYMVMILAVLANLSALQRIAMAAKIAK